MATWPKVRDDLGGIKLLVAPEINDQVKAEMKLLTMRASALKLILGYPDAEPEEKKKEAVAAAAVEEDRVENRT